MFLAAKQTAEPPVNKRMKVKEVDEGYCKNNFFDQNHIESSYSEATKEEKKLFFSGSIDTDCWIHSPIKKHNLNCDYIPIHFDASDINLAENLVSSFENMEPDQMCP
jgi:hypothetical protein